MKQLIILLALGLVLTSCNPNVEYQYCVKASELGRVVFTGVYNAPMESYIEEGMEMIPAGKSWDQIVITRLPSHNAPKEAEVYRFSEEDFYREGMTVEQLEERIKQYEELSREHWARIDSLLLEVEQ